MGYDGIILFTSYYFAAKAERELNEAGEAVLIIATPKALHHACGLCLLFKRERLKQVQSIMQHAHINWTGIYGYKDVNGPYETLEEAR